MRIVDETVTFRENNNVQRNDFMSLLIDLKNSKDVANRLNMNEIAAQVFFFFIYFFYSLFIYFLFLHFINQAFVFFLAGFETSSTTLTYCLYELALEKHKHIQDEARREIFSTLEKYGGELTYEAVNEMAYIDQIINGRLSIRWGIKTSSQGCCSFQCFW